ncbi:MAG: nitronate monooxygenase [Alicyclobacillus shizuokensis]|nr:nitronate monooxygenase [Alicyclobacillus shizuokensis]
MKTRVCQILGCEYPIVEGGLAYVGNGRLAAAVSEGGGFGQVGSGGRSPEDFRREIEIAASCTQKPFGVNVPLSEHRSPDAYFQVIEEMAAHIRAVSLSAGNPIPYVAPLQRLGLVVMTLASTPRQAQKAEEAGVDLVICEGVEAGGHDGPAELTTLSLVPAVCDVVSIPVVAAGGIADGRTAAAAFCLGAEGVQMGTRFVATIECQAHGAYKQAIVDGDVTATLVMERSLGRVTRVLDSPYTRAVLKQEQETPGDLNQILPLVAGRKNAAAALEGRLDEGWANCGQSLGLVHEILPAAEVVSRIMQDVGACLSRRASAFLQDGRA